MAMPIFTLFEAGTRRGSAVCARSKGLSQPSPGQWSASGMRQDGTCINYRRVANCIFGPPRPLFVR